MPIIKGVYGHKYDVDLVGYLYPGMKGFVLNDGEVLGWSINDAYAPHHDDVFDQHFFATGQERVADLYVAKDRPVAGITILYYPLDATKEDIIERALNHMTFDDLNTKIHIQDFEDEAEYESLTLPEVRRKYGHVHVMRGNPPEKCYTAPRDVSGYEGISVQYTPSYKTLGKLRWPDDIVEIGRRLNMIDDTRERMYAIYMNIKNQILGYRLISAGSIAQTLVDPKIVFGPAIALQAPVVALMHNHPAGDADFSAEDVHSAKRLIEDGKKLAVRVLDFIVVGREGVVSLHETQPHLFQTPTATANPDARHTIQAWFDQVRPDCIPHHSVDLEKVKKMKAFAGDGWPFKPVLVVDYDNYCYTLDGHHRIETAHQLDIEKIPAWLVDGADFEKLLQEEFDSDIPARMADLREHILMPDGRTYEETWWGPATGGRGSCR